MGLGYSVRNPGPSPEEREVGLGVGAGDLAFGLGCNRPRCSSYGLNETHSGRSGWFWQVPYQISTVHAVFIPAQGVGWDCLLDNNIHSPDFDKRRN